MRFRVLAGALLGTLTLVAWVEGKGPKQSYGGVETQNTGATVPSAVVEKKVAKLTERVKWHSSLDEAKDQARKDNKPIFWLHALGDLDGVC
jgi:hypothetical protein